MSALIERLRGGLVPAVPVPFSGGVLHAAAQEAYAQRMAGEPISGVAVWAHTGRGPHLSAEDRRTVITTWREALPGKLVIAGAHDITTAIDARRRHADALLIHPERNDPVTHHDRLSRELPGIAFWLYEGAGGVAYDDDTLHRILELPAIIGIKVATLDSVMTFQRLAGLVRQHPDKLLITGEDRFLGYSLMAGAEAALVGLGAAVPKLSAELLHAHRMHDAVRFIELSGAVDQFAEATFCEPMNGYVRRMLWAAAATGWRPASATEDPWGPALESAEHDVVEAAVRNALDALG
jgi:4-hydroxy-tetrahydrodipicolinate synthase